MRGLTAVQGDALLNLAVGPAPMPIVLRPAASVQVRVELTPVRLCGAGCGALSLRASLLRPNLPPLAVACASPASAGGCSLAGHRGLTRRSTRTRL